MATVHRPASTGTPGVSAALRDGLRRMAEAVGCRAVFGFLLSRDGRLRLKASFPGSAVVSRTADPDDAPALFEAMYEGRSSVVDPAECAPAIPEAAGAVACVAVPLQGASGPVGIAVAAAGAAVSERDLACLTALGQATAVCVEAARATEVLARRAHASERTVRRLISGVLEGGAVGFVLDLDGRVLRWSKGAAERLGWSEHELRGARLPVSGETGARYIAELRTKAAAEGPFHASFDLECRDGSTERIEGVGVAVAAEDEDACAVLFVCREPDLPLTHAGSLRQAYLAALVERELASPLTAIKGYAELLARPSIAEDALQRTRVARALSERAREVERVLMDLALLSGLERSSGLIAESIELGGLVAEVARRVNANHGREVFSVEARAGARVLIDRACAERSLEGLLRCVARSCGASEGVTVSVRHEREAVEVLIDAMQGVPKALVSEPSPYAVTEAGIGFHLARMTAEAHGGDVWLEAADSGRARIGIRLPAHDGSEESAWLVPMV